MRHLLVLAAVIAAPALAQTGHTIAPPSAAATAAFSREQQAAGELNRYSDREPYAVRTASLWTIQHAAAWGRCVAAASPDLSRAYVDTKHADPALKPVFNACLRRTGDFAMSNWGDVRRAALSDALGAR